jgi:hypothetical protein
LTSHGGTESKLMLWFGIIVSSAYGFEFVSLREDEREKIRAACASLKEYEGGWY